MDLASFTLAAALLTAGPEDRPDHWAWKPIRRPAIPQVRERAWVENEIDAFILSKLEARGLSPAARASREELIRRASFDLTGLPPKPEEVDAFLNDGAKGAWETLIDRLLASPRFGERWGRHWLDLARFAESNGYEHDEVRPDAWRYRDYVIRAFNDDKPLDRFILEQLAGDELFPEDPDALIATGFNLLGPDMTDASDAAQRRHNSLSDMTDTAAVVFLGMTIGCARCHDHKFEPIPQRDYYRFEAFFTPASFRTDISIGTPAERERFDAAMRDYQALTRPLEEEIARLEAPHRARLREEKLGKIADEARAAHVTPVAERTPAQRELVEKTERLLASSADEVTKALSAEERPRRDALRAEVKKLDAKKPAPLPTAMGLATPTGAATKTFLLTRGEITQPGEEVAPGYPQVIASGAPEPPREGRGRRAALARWIASADNPLTSRVLANRVWMHLFGRGIAPAPSDFGVRGEPPTHPDLVDWLAFELIARRWSLKALLKTIMTSASYLQASRASAAASEKDPDNRLFSRQNRKRLEGEVVRDALLAASGRLNEAMGGPGVRPPLPAGAAQGADASKVWPVSPDPADHVRRSVYIFARRNLRYPFLETFDGPDTSLSCPRRERSTTAPQALTLLNSEDVVEAAKALAERVSREASGEDERVVLAFRRVLGRRPTAGELEGARDFLRQSPLSELCRALFNTNEFVYED